MEEPLLELKSKYRVLYEFLDRHALTLLIVMGLSYFLLNTELFVYYWIGVGIYIVFILLYTLYNMKKFNSRKYYFYEKYMVYEYGFLKKEKRNIPYDLVKGVKIKQGLLQLFLKTGDIYISLHGEKLWGSGIFLCGIKEVQKNYEIIYNTILASRVRE